MPFGNIIQALLKLARVALASLLLVGVPMADAFACSSESLASSAVSDVALADAEMPAVAAETADHGSQPSGDAQHCIHGHCHHSTPFRTNEDDIPPYASASAAIAPYVGAVAVTRVSSSLERPPKA